MANRKRYYALDEIGIVGVQDKRTKSQIKRDMETTVQFIKERKSGKKPHKSSSKKGVSK